MTEQHESYPGIHPLEFVGDDELALAKYMTGVAMERKFQDDLHILLADVAMNMQQKNIAGNVLWWTAYEEADNQSESDVMFMPACGVVVLFAPGSIDESDKENRMPFLRITKSERILVDDGNEFLTYDMCINTKGESCYSYSSFPVRESLSSKKSVVPLFKLDDSGSIMCSEQANIAYMPVLAPGKNDNFMPDVTFLPFGHYEDPFTKLLVVEKMREIFETIKDEQPVAWSRMAAESDS